MKSFLSLVVRDVLEATGGDPGRSVFIFPNRRAGRTFSRELHRQIPRPVFSPEVYSIDDWMVRLSGLVVPDRLTRLAALYPVVRKQLDYQGSFGQFLDFGEMILNDFDDVDKYLADPAVLFRGLTEYKKTEAIIESEEYEQIAALVAGFWGSFSDRTSRHQENWLATWENLENIYRSFHEVLVSRGLATSGMCYRKVADRIRGGYPRLEETELVGLVGFNALTRAEEELFTYLRDTGKARFYWDYHPFYCNGLHEAGQFIQRHLRQFPPPDAFSPFPGGENSLFDPQPESPSVRVLPVTSQSGQIHLLTRLLREDPTGPRGIVLADESGLADLIRTWTDDLGQVNFSSGFPAGETLAASFIQCFSDWLAARGTADAGTFDTSDTIALLAHPWVGALLTVQEREWGKNVKGSYPEVVPEEYFLVKPGLPLINNLPGLVRRPLEILEQYVDWLLARGIPATPLERAVLNALSKELDQVRRVAVRWNLSLDCDSAFKLLARFIQRHRVTLEPGGGEPVTLVTGILETRLLDFQEVYILSLNEGIWPSRSLPASLIPYSLRKFFRLPVAEHRDHIYSYYFYRLLQRARKVTLLYLTGHRDDQINSGEKSRYVTQIELETPLELLWMEEPSTRISTGEGPLVIQKSGRVLEKLQRFLDPANPSKSISPSALKDYLDCTIRFAFSKILDIREPWEPGSASEPKGFGTLVHLVMEGLYKPFAARGGGPDGEWLDRIIRNPGRIDELLDVKYPESLGVKGAHNPGGKDQLGLGVARDFILAILRVDRKSLPFKILRTEDSIGCSYLFEEGPAGRAVNLGGIIDRIDETPDGLRVVDYKTGKTNLKFKQVESIFNATDSLKDVFQVLLYCEMYGSVNGWDRPLLPAIYPVMDFLGGNDTTRIGTSQGPLIYQEARPEFRSGLHQLLNELFDPSIPFTQTDDAGKCQWCLYSGICRRDG
ncbi:MAG: PD-(D/E)XK nuclease family protein [Bacteroidales bacterium]